MALCKSGCSAVQCLHQIYFIYSLARAVWEIIHSQLNDDKWLYVAQSYHYQIFIVCSCIATTCPSHINSYLRNIYDMRACLSCIYYQKINTMVGGLTRSRSFNLLHIVFCFAVKCNIFFFCNLLIDTKFFYICIVPIWFCWYFVYRRMYECNSCEYVGWLFIDKLTMFNILNMI